MGPLAIKNLKYNSTKNYRSGQQLLDPSIMQNLSVVFYMSTTNMFVNANQDTFDYCQFLNVQSTFNTIPPMRTPIP